MIWFGLVGGMMLYLLAWLFGDRNTRCFADYVIAFFGWLTAGAIFGVLIALGVSFADDLWTISLTETWGTAEIILFICGVPWVLMSQLVAEIILVGLTSASSRRPMATGNGSGRVAGWMLVFAVGWLALMALVFLGSGWVEGLFPKI